MDFSFDFDCIPMYNPSDNHQLKDKINELEKNQQNTLDKVKLHEDRLNRHHGYCSNIFKKLEEVDNNISHILADYNKKKIDIQKNINVVKGYITNINIINIEIIQKQKEQEKQIIELQEVIQKQKEQEKQIIELQEVIQKQKEQEKQIIESKEVVSQEKSKKRNFDNISNDYIERLSLTKKRSKPWVEGMSKYISITIVNDRWRWESTIFDENHKNFKVKEDAEKHFENVIAKYNIDPIHITRSGYENK
jgi:hypothetical protein